MNYIVINGKDSRDVDGLLIQSLPNISKPLLRTEVEEIDGVDGDRVTALGYSAYDKVASIGLHGRYNVDDVISFFDSEGEVIFSNEPDKKYRFKMIQQIDFERLGRFKTAEVAFHVQPFKYDAVKHATEFNSERFVIPDTKIVSGGVTLTAVNNVVTITGTATRDQQIYLPIEDVTLTAGSYTLESWAGDAQACVCYNSPSNSMAGTFDLGENQTVTVSETKTYNYVWFILPKGTVNITTSFTVINNAVTSISFRNRGNVFSKPTVTVYGSGNVTLSLNGSRIFAIALADFGYITIDVEKMNAYKGTQLMNRYVSGDYDLLHANVGINVLTWTGNVTHMDIFNYSRWI